MSKDLAVICNGTVEISAPNDTVEIDEPNLIEITPLTTCNRVEMLGLSDWEAWRPHIADNFRIVFGDMPLPSALPTLKNGHIGRRHIVGLLILLEEIATRGERPFVRNPEAYLHPKQQTGLGDLFIKLSKDLSNE